jgi:pimeloyl-ACP methyl ester carboxylesterase
MPTVLQNLYSLPTSPRLTFSASEPKRDARPEPRPVADRDSVMLGKRKASWITDAIAVSQFVGSGVLYKDAAEAAAEQKNEKPPLSDAATVKLEDPFLILPGWTTLPEKFDDMIAHLLKNPENGERAVYLKEGQAYSDKQCTRQTDINQSDKVFLCVYDDVLSPPDKTAPQIAKAVEMIKGQHGDKVDVLGYSMGGVAVRKMLDQDLQEVDQIAFLGASHKGARFAALAKYVIQRDINFAMNLAGVNAAHLPAMQWMLPVEPGNPDSSPNLSALNQNLERQLENCNEMYNIGSDGFSTITESWGKSEGGDGLVHFSSTQLEGVPGVVVPGRGLKQHGNLPSDTDAFNELKNYFNWQEV